MTINCTFDKPYDFYIEAYGKGKTSGRYGPEAIIGLTKRNVFRGGEKLNLRIHGSYEWSASSDDNGNDRLGLNNYEYGAEASLQFPRLVNPFVTTTTKDVGNVKRERVLKLQRRDLYISLRDHASIIQHHQRPLKLLLMY